MRDDLQADGGGQRFQTGFEQRSGTNPEPSVLGLSPPGTLVEERKGRTVWPREDGPQGFQHPGTKRRRRRRKLDVSVAAAQHF